ncbi:hypothetical protein Tco_0400173 [Tanacetum coccineum]
MDVAFDHLRDALSVIFGLSVTQGKVFIEVGHKWKPTGRLVTIVGNSCPLTRITPKKIQNLKETTFILVETPKPEIKVYSRRPKQIKSIDVPSSSSLINDMLSRLSSEGVDILSGSRDKNLYTISLDDMLKTSPICLLSKASKTKSWLWHHRLSHLNFACALGKSKKSHQPKAEDTNQEKLYLLHMDLCSPMRVESINGKSSGPGLHLMTPATTSSGLVPNTIPQQPCNPPNRDD